MFHPGNDFVRTGRSPKRRVSIKLAAMIEQLQRCLRDRAPMAISLLEKLVLENSFTGNPRGGALVGEMLAAELQSIPE